MYFVSLICSIVYSRQDHKRTVQILPPSRRIIGCYSCLRFENIFGVHGWKINKKSATTMKLRRVNVFPHSSISDIFSFYKSVNSGQNCRELFCNLRRIIHSILTLLNLNLNIIQLYNTEAKY